MTLRAVLASAVAEGELRRSVAANVPSPREVARIPESKVAKAWDDEELDAVLDTIRDHRWGGPMRLEVLYGLRRSELLALRWTESTCRPVRSRSKRASSRLTERWFGAPARTLDHVGGFRSIPKLPARCPRTGAAKRSNAPSS